MYFLIYFAAAVLFSSALFIEKKFLRGKNLITKIGLILLVAVFAVRYFSVDKRPVFDEMWGLDSFRAIGLSGGRTVLAVISQWLSIVALILCVSRPFFKIKTVTAISRYLIPISAILSILTINSNVAVTTGSLLDGKITFLGVMLAIEGGIQLCYGAFYLVGDIREGCFKDFKFDLKFILFALLMLLLMLLATYPSYALQFIVGKIKGAKFLVIDLSPTHRIYLYLSFIIPLSAYFLLRKREEEVIRFSMIFMTVGTMITYAVGYSYKTTVDLSEWPFHLCNTAAFVVPICLIFRLNKVFYFTYFINVLGAMLAMLMPNYDEGTNMLSYEMFNFWINHWGAFFYPLILVGLGLFERPKLKQFIYSMAWFGVYYVLVLVLNVYFTAQGKTVDFFFINSNFVADKLGVWAEKIFNVTASFELNGKVYAFHPVYQALYFVVYIGLGLGMWFLYELFFNLSASHQELNQKLNKIRLDQFYLEAQLDGRSIEEPMNKDAGIKLELKNFSKKYSTNKHYAVKNANLEVNGGEIFGFLGPNGAGKSTIIKSIVGIQPITEGSIEICGFDVQKQHVMAKSLIGYVPDHYALYEKLTGREYINYIADIFDVSEEDRNARLEKYIKLFELESSIDNSIKTYSHGMKQKITIMAALVHNPKLWILDEPLTGLDPNSIFQVKECMRQHAEEGNIVFFSSHIIDVVEKLCDRITIIKKGEIQCAKTIEEVEAECSLEEFYLKTIGADDLIGKED